MRGSEKLWKERRSYWVVLGVQFYSNRELEDQLTKIRDVLSDDKHDWEQRVVAVCPLTSARPPTDEPG